ncbi:hypothetical protein BT69DRAFT_1285664 [Atractiella rhizophila]|nr:hypothetical protein BT69DRAFT_1285664 [Atractiella rhizophila]
MCLVSEEYRNCGKDDSEREDAKGCIMMCIEVRQLLTDPTNLLNKCMKRRGAPNTQAIEPQSICLIAREIFAPKVFGLTGFGPPTLLKASTTPGRFAS